MAQLDWDNLSFQYRKTNAIVVSTFKDGKWSEPQAVKDFEMGLNIYAGALHYASSCFEGLKAFRGQDGKIRIFRPDENAKRMMSSANYLDMPAVPQEMFIDMVIRCVKANEEFIPPFGHNASLYVRPLLFGSNPQMGVHSSLEATFAVIGTPVGSYSGAAALSAGTAVIARNFDRAAPNGTGCYKLSANYAPSFKPYNIAHGQGYRELLFLDPATKTKIDEFGSSNFLAIKGDTYVTPLSNSVLPSITNKSLRTLAADFGMGVEIRPVPVEELAEFDEVNACGTAVVITPIYRIDDKAALEDANVVKSYNIGREGLCGPKSQKLYNTLRGIQDGLEQDIHSWCIIL